MIKKFKNNIDYFLWYEKIKNKYKIVDFKIYKRYYVVEYEKI